VTKRTYEKQNEATTKRKKKEKEKMERQKSEVVGSEIAPPENVTKHSQNVRTSIHCAATSELGKIELLYVH